MRADLPRWLRRVRARRAGTRAGSAPVGQGLDRGVALRGRIWSPDEGSLCADGVLVVGPDGAIAALGASGEVTLPEGVRRLGGPGRWVGPGLVDAHVHLAFGGPGAALAGGLVAVRDLGAPLAAAMAWQAEVGPPCCAVAGPLLTSPGGYPTRSWGVGGFGAEVTDAAVAARLVRALAADGVDVIKVALEPAAGSVPSPEVLRAAVDAAHALGLGVTAHALTVSMVERALDAGVDELAHTPVEVLPDALVGRLADRGTPVVSTLQALCRGGSARAVLRNAAALHAGGVPLVYGTDLGNAGTRPGVDPRELDRLARVGLGREGALRLAATAARTALGMGSAPAGRLAVGHPAHVVLLDTDPLVEPAAWRAPLAVVSAGRVLAPLG